MLYRQHELTATNVTFVLKVLTSIYNDLRAVNLVVSKMVIIYIVCTCLRRTYVYKCSNGRDMRTVVCFVINCAL